MLLVIETATEACSVALFDGGDLVAQRHEVIGRGHSERLLPMISELPDGGRADRILVDCGPGSFTGVRVGLAAARALALAWRAEATGYSSLALLAAAAFAKCPGSDRVAVAILAGHGEVFLQRFSPSPFAALAPLASLTPAAALDAIDAPLVAGNAAGQLIDLGAESEALDLLPCAADAGLLPEGYRNLPPRPVYGRGPDAKPMQ